MMDDFYRLFSQKFGRRIANAIIKINGTCCCSQCQEKMRELYAALDLRDAEQCAIMELREEENLE